jgi:hypothetical protein
MAYQHDVGPTRKRALAALAALATLAFSPFTVAVEVDPGDYTALPAGANAFVVYGQYAKRNALYASGNRVPIDAKLDSSVGILRVLRVVAINDKWTVDPQFLLPFGSLKAGHDLAALGSASGIGDLILNTAFKYKIDEKSGEVLGISPFLWLPTGKYDASKPLNLGEKRWKFALQAAYTRPVTDRVRWDILGDVQVHGDNDDCRAACGSATDVKLKQDALHHWQTHLRYQVAPSLFAAVSFGHVQGGSTTIDGVAQSNKQKTTYARLAAGYFVTPTTQVLTTLGRDLQVDTGLKENIRLNLRLFTIF